MSQNLLTFFREILIYKTGGMRLQICTRNSKYYVHSKNSNIIVFSAPASPKKKIKRKINYHSFHILLTYFHFYFLKYCDLNINSKLRGKTYFYLFARFFLNKFSLFLSKVDQEGKRLFDIYFLVIILISWKRLKISMTKFNLGNFPGKICHCFSCTRHYHHYNSICETK